MNDKTKKLFNDLADLHPEVRYHQGLGEGQTVTLSPVIRLQILGLLKDSGLAFTEKVPGEILPNGVRWGSTRTITGDIEL